MALEPASGGSNSPAVKDFWSRIVHWQGGGTGPSYLSGWITAFCARDAQGQPLFPLEATSLRGSERHPDGQVCEVDGVHHLGVDTSDIPNGYVRSSSVDRRQWRGDHGSDRGWLSGDPGHEQHLMMSRMRKRAWILYSQYRDGGCSRSRQTRQRVRRRLMWLRCVHGHERLRHNG
jgi:hypothetical protein